MWKGSGKSDEAEDSNTFRCRNLANIAKSDWGPVTSVNTGQFLIDWFINGWMDGWMDGQMEGLMDGQMDRQAGSQASSWVSE
jgi:hypothetical protein